MDFQFAVSAGSKIYYHERGKGEPLVLIMGFGADGPVWNKHVAVYENHFRCIILDNRGVGKSDQPKGPYTTAMMAADTVAVMDHAGVKIARVAGISMGGAIAQELAIRYPGRVKSLMLVSTWAKFNNYAATVYENLKKIRATAPPEVYMELLQLWIFAPPYFESESALLKNDVISYRDSKEKQTRDGFDGQLDACIHHDSTDRLNKINTPTLVTVGLMDIFTPPAFSEVLHKGIKNSSFSTYPEGGHVHHWEDLERFNKESLDFLLKH
ncbi:MAG TPA: alpha/beta fold hydrolase [Flavitalea sp.]|nr:alpha/beta fold hydrolase [Flavitalea sp.]